MARSVAARHVVSVLCFIIAADPRFAAAANMRSFIEAVRLKAPVVYVGRVREVQLLRRTKFDIKARAIVDIIAVTRTPGPKPPEATFEYSTYDLTTPILAGGPQYQLEAGVKVVVFANSFAGSVPPGYLVQGTLDELLERIEALRDRLAHMSPAQLTLNEINEQDRRIQLDVYDKLTNDLRSKR